MRKISDKIEEHGMTAVGVLQVQAMASVMASVFHCSLEM